MLRKPGEYDPSKRVQVSARRKTAEGPDDVVRKLSRLPANKKCADCSAKLPQAVNLTHGTFVCLTCSGVHREFSHRVKGIGASSFLPEEAEFLSQHGNEKVNQKYLANYHPASERLKEPDGSMSNVDGYLLREWLRRKYIDRSFMETGHERTGLAIHNTNTGPTRAKIPPKESVAQTPVPASTTDLLGGWDTLEAPPKAMATSNVDAEWDAFGQSRAQENLFHADFGSQNTSNATFQADFSQADTSVLSSIPAEPQQPPPPPPPDGFHANFDQFGGTLSTQLSAPPEVQQSFHPDFSTFQANQPPAQMDQQGLKQASDSFPPATQTSLDIPPLQMQQQPLQQQTICNDSPGLMNTDISNSPSVQPAFPPSQLNDPAPSRPQIMHQQFFGTQLEQASFQIQQQQLDMPAMPSEPNLDILNPTSHHQSIQQQKIVQAHENIPTPQLEQLSMQQQSSVPSVSTELNELVPSLQVTQQYQQQVPSQPKFSQLSHDDSVCEQGTMLPTFNLQQSPNAVVTYEKDCSNSFQVHSDGNFIPSPTGGVQSVSTFSQENQMQMTESSNVISSEQIVVDQALTKAASSSLDNCGSKTSNSFGNINSNPDDPDTNGMALNCAEHNLSSINKGNKIDRKFHSGQAVVYKSGEIVTVIKVHLDDDLVPFYDIRFQDGKEKQTTHEYLIAAEESSRGIFVQSIQRILERLNEEQLAKTQQFLESNFSQI